MSTEHVILCGDVPAGSAGAGPAPEAGATANPLRLRLWGAGHEVTLKIEHISERLARTIPDRFLDLVEIAAYVTSADHAITRGGSHSDDFGLNWRRRLRFQIPVRDLDFWGSRPVTTALCETLGFQSEDEYQFDFQPLTNPPGVQYYLEFSNDWQGPPPEEVVMFSGGVDSTGGVVQEVVTDKRRVVLVTHRPTEKLRRRHDNLCALLDGHAGPFRPHHVPVTVNKLKSLNREYTQRSRSFLFAALGATVAQLHGLSRIRFYENGVVSLNLPLSPQVVGAKASRTTHPRVLNGFEQVLSLVAGRPFRVENPFVWKTKAEVVRLIADAGCGDLIGHTTSCTHTWEMTREHWHCGGCSQCVDRRFAVLAAGQEANDPAKGYKVDLLADARSEGEHRTMIAAYVETASAVAKMGPLQFFARYGEVSRVLRHLGGSADAAAMKVFDLYRKHAAAVGRVVDEGIARYSTQLRNRELPDTCLLRLVCDAACADAAPAPANSTPVAAAAPQPPAADPGPPLALADNVFRRKGQVWLARFAGRDEFVLLPSKGVAYLHLLLSSAGKAHSVVDLAFQVAKAPAKFSLGDAGERSDKEAEGAYRARYQEIQEELEDARERNDEGAIEALRRDMELLANELKVCGWNGKPKKERDDRERIRKAFYAAVRRTIETIANYDKSLAAHLDATIRRGTRPAYEPPDPIDWDT